MPDRQLISGAPQAEDLPFEAGLRPRRLADFTGQGGHAAIRLLRKSGVELLQIVRGVPNKVLESMSMVTLLAPTISETSTLTVFSLP